MIVGLLEAPLGPPLDADCGTCTLCIEACPTGALDEPGVVDSTKCLSYWTQAPAPIPEDYRAELGAQVYGCDICQDVCPWNRGVEKRRGELPPGVHDLPAEIDRDIARVKLESLGISIDSLTAEQEAGRRRW